MERRPSGWKIGSDHVVLLLLLCASLTLNVYLGIRARESSHKAAAWGLARPLLRSGDAVGTIRAIQLGATRHAVDLSLEEPTILYLFRPSCPWCRVNAEAMTALYVQARQQYRFLALSTESAGLDVVCQTSLLGDSDVSLVGAGEHSNRAESRRTSGDAHCQEGRGRAAVDRRIHGRDEARH